MKLSFALVLLLSAQAASSVASRPMIADAASPAPSPSPSFSTSTSSSSFPSPPDPTAPFPGGGAWYEARARARPTRSCSDPAIGLVHGSSDGSPSSAPRQDLVALGSLAALRAAAKSPNGDKGSIEEFVSRPLTLISVDSPRLCLTAPNVAASTPEKNREEGVDVAVSACNVPGAATPSVATVFSVENAPKSSEFAPSPSSSVSPSSTAPSSASPALRFRSLPRRSIENAPVTTAGAHSGAAPVVDLRPASAKAAKATTTVKPASSGGGDLEDASEPSRCLVASGGRARLSRCPPPSSPSFAASTWRVAPANVTVAALVVDDDLGDASATPPRKPQAGPRYTWKTSTGFLLVNQASGDCASASGEIAACDPRADGMLFSLCSGPGQCAQFQRPEC